MMTMDGDEAARTARRRSPEAGGYASGARKRIAIIEAALRLFGDAGYEGASTRDIAEAAGVNPPAIQYYFGGKEGLYRACALHVIDDFRTGLARIATVEAAASAERALDVLCDVLDYLVDRIFDKFEQRGWSRFMARIRAEDPQLKLDPELAQSRDALDDVCNRLVAVVLGRDPDDAVTKLRTMMVLGQFSMLHFRHDRGLEWLGWPDLRGERLLLLKRELRLQTRAALSGVVR